MCCSVCSFICNAMSYCNAISSCPGNMVCQKPQTGAGETFQKQWKRVMRVLIAMASMRSAGTGED